MKSRMALYFAFVLLLNGCQTSGVKSKFQAYPGAVSYPEIEPEQVKVFYTPPLAPHEELGELEVTDPMYDESRRGALDFKAQFTREGRLDARQEIQNKFEERLKDETAKLGGDAFVLTSDGEAGHTRGARFSYEQTISDPKRPVPYGRRVRGIVIKFKE